MRKFIVEIVTRTVVACAAITAPAICLAASDNVVCVREHLAKAGATAPNVPNDVEILTAHIARSIGLSSSVIAVSCKIASKASAWVPKVADGVPIAQYILYDPIWIREVTGNNPAKGIALFGHELGHLLNHHFTDRESVDAITKESEADRFAGCAVARLVRSFSNLEELLHQLRDEVQSDLYPDRLASIKSARAGFDACSDVPNESDRRMFSVQAAQSPGLDVLHANTKSTMAERLANNVTLNRYLRMEFVPYGSVATSETVLGAVQRGTLSGVMFRSGSRPGAVGLIPISCGDGNWLLVNADIWAAIQDAAAAALIRVCSSPL